MKRKRIMAFLTMLSISACCCQSVGAATINLQPRALQKSDSGNPMLGFDENGDILYGGDPSILVDGDTVYCYVGHDTASGEGYWMPDWRCYSSKDMKNWKYESTIMKSSDITGGNNHEAWAGQVVKGDDEKYYFYYCTEYSDGKGIGVGVSDSPTGPFVDVLKKPLVSNSQTGNSVHSWEDIDPTVWIETGKDGQRHRYLGWGNTRFFVCELNEDMISVKDRDGNSSNLSVGFADDGTFDVVIGKINGNGRSADGKTWFGGENNNEHFYTEAPYYYRQQDAEGNYVGPYYMFFACDWREQMAYATTDDIMSNEWTFGGIIMEPSATANTNHMAVFDFEGQPYFVYHDGSLAHGSGYRRVACVEPLTIKSDGSIDLIKKTATGLTGTASTITDSEGNYIAHKSFTNVLDDSFYPITGKSLQMQYDETEECSWEINVGKTDKTDENLVSIESNNKPGLYISAEEKNGVITPVLSQDVKGSEDEAQRMTFKTWKGANGSGVTFESLKYPGYYLASENGSLRLTDNPQEEEETFYVSSDVAVKAYEQGNVLKTKRFYCVGDTLNVDDIQILLYGENEQVQKITKYTTNVKDIDMSKTGEKTLRVTYEYNGETYTEDVAVTVVESEYFGR